MHLVSDTDLLPMLGVFRLLVGGVHAKPDWGAEKQGTSCFNVELTGGIKHFHLCKKK